MLISANAIAAQLAANETVFAMTEADFAAIDADMKPQPQNLVDFFLTADEPAEDLFDAYAATVYLRLAEKRQAKH